MKEVEQLYYNDFGVAFHWKKNNEVLRDKVQVVFKETGFYLSLPQIREFTVIIENTCKNMKCTGCTNSGDCRKFLLKTPFEQLDLAVCKSELLQIKDLMEGALFNFEMYKFLANEGRN